MTTPKEEKVPDRRRSSVRAIDPPEYGVFDDHNKEERRYSIVYQKPNKWFGVRHLQCIFLALLLCIGYGMRVNLSVGIVAMTDPTINPGFKTYDWHDESIILSSFFWGYILPQVVAGQVSKNYGARWFLVGTMTGCSLFTALIPVMADLGSWGVMICRIVQGFTQGFFYPCVHTMLTKWAPLPERSRLGAFVFAGGPLGSVIAMPLTGWISGSSYGWPFAFYLYGLLGFVWAVGFSIFGSNSPSETETITPEEKLYIETSLGVKTEHSERMPTPWKAIFTSLPVWAILATHCAQNWGFWTLLTEMPTYMKNVLNFDIKANGLLSACPYFTMWVMSFIFSGFTDYIINKDCVSIGTGRKIANSIGLYIPAAALILLGTLDSGVNMTGMVISLLIIAVGSNAAHMCGYQVNHLDLSPTHAGTLMGITNGFSNIFSILGPLLVHYVVVDKHDPNQWKLVFLIAGGIYIFGNTFYVLFGSGDIQPWDTCEAYDDDDDIEKNEKSADKS
ncbi:putative inorganic phosphate cotransporter isoform X2 [Photinus pyralis]|nr:putative inorganic phosphate cotransporter isoform X2 [Photinus pyralis]